MESFGVTPSTNTGDSLLRQARDARTLPRGQDTRTYQRAGEAQEVGLRGQHTLTCLWGREAQEVGLRGWLSCLRGAEPQEVGPRGQHTLTCLRVGEAQELGPRGWLSCLLSPLVCRQRPPEVCPALLPGPSPGPQQHAPGGQDPGHGYQRRCVCEPSRWPGFAVSDQNPLYNWIPGNRSPTANVLRQQQGLRETSFTLDPQSHTQRLSSKPGRATARAPQQSAPARPSVLTDAGGRRPSDGGAQGCSTSAWAEAAPAPEAWPSRRE